MDFLVMILLQFVTNCAWLFTYNVRIISLFGHITISLTVLLTQIIILLFIRLICFWHVILRTVGAHLVKVASEVDKIKLKSFSLRAQQLEYLCCQQIRVSSLSLGHYLKCSVRVPDGFTSLFLIQFLIFLLPPFSCHRQYFPGKQQQMCTEETTIQHYCLDANLFLTSMLTVSAAELT